MKGLENKAIFALGCAVRKLLDVVFPRNCPVCGGKSDRPGRHVCWECLAKIPANLSGRAHCVICGKIPDGEVSGDFVCGQCISYHPRYDKACHALPYAGAASELIQTFKYRRGTWLADDLVDWLEGAVRANFDVESVDAVVSVPLHFLKKMKRGYNQSEILASKLAGRIGVKYRGNAVRRVVWTSTQTRLGAVGRRDNVRDVFRVTEPEDVAGRTILVVDDVMTTGATFGEMARVLKKAGAARVLCAAIARD